MSLSCPVLCGRHWLDEKKHFNASNVGRSVSATELLEQIFDFYFFIYFFIYKRRFFVVASNR